MPNKQKLKRQRREAERQARRVTRSERPRPAVASPAHSTIAQKLLQGGTKNMEEATIQLLLESAEWRNEPEFQTLQFDVNQIEVVGEQLMHQHEKPYEKQFERVANASEDKRQEVYDEYQMDVIKKLITPNFRQDVLQRLGRYAERLQATDQTRWELASLLKVTLETSQFSWGLCGLIVVIYEEAFQQMRTSFVAELSLLEEFKPLLSQGSPTHVLDWLNEPKNAAALAQKLEASPNVMDRLSSRVDQLAQEFEDKLMRGEFSLLLFTMEELAAAFRQIDAMAKRRQITPDEMPSEQLAAVFAEGIRHNLKIIMTPARIQQMQTDLQSLSREWIAQLKPEGVLLQSEIRWLTEEATDENNFLYTAYVGELRQVMPSDFAPTA